MIKVLYAGSPEAARQTLEILVQNQSQNGFEIAGVLSNPPSAKGRHKDLIPTPVAQYAMENNIPVFTPEHLDSAAREEIGKIGFDVLVCFAYGHIFGPKFLSMFKFGGMNLHPSLLPKYRGCTPVPAAIINRDKQTAATIQTLSLKMDEGDILAQTVVDLDGTETNESLLNDCAKKGAFLILGLLKDIDKNGIMKEGIPQKGDSSYTNIITKEDARINWNASAKEIEALVRAYYPEPACWTMEKGQTIKILKAKFLEDRQEFAGEVPGKVLLFSKAEGILIKTKDGILSALELQRQGKKAMNYKDFMNGARDFIGTVLGD